MSSSLFKHSAVSLKQKSLKRNFSSQLLTPELPQIQKYDTSKLFEEFKQNFLRKDEKQLNKNTALNNGYKNLICEIKKSKDQKKNQLEKLSTKLYHVNHQKSNSSRTLFQDIKNCYSQTPNIIEESAVPLKQDFSSCKFKPIRPMTSDTKFRINNGKSRVANQSIEGRFGQDLNSAVTIQNSKVTKISQSQLQSKEQLSNWAQKSLPQISESILLVQAEQSQLEDEIYSLKQSLNKLKKQLETVKKQLEIENRNQEKYKHISYLATSIKNQTQYIRQQNTKGFNSMAQRQDESLSQLKKFKTNLRKQKDDMETQYIEDINHWVDSQEESNAAKKREFLFSSINTHRQSEELKPEHKGYPRKFQLVSKCQDNGTKSKSNSMIAKSMKRLVDQLDIVVDMLQKNQTNFQDIKERQCTKVRLGKVNKSLLSKQKVQILQKIQDFEEKYQMKISSVQNLILNVYHSLFNSNKTLETECLNLTQTKEELEQQFKQILEKHQNSIDTYENHFKRIQSEEIQRRKTNQILKRNSVVFLKIVEAFYTILFKFRYMFSLALTLDVDKKSFRDSVIQIDSCFSSGIFFNFNCEKHLITSSQRHDIINEKQFQEIMMDKKVAPQIIKQTTETLFNDHRINLILHKSWIQNKLKSLVAGQITENQILDIIESVKTDCEQIYLMRLPVVARLFLTCLKTVSMTKYETKLAASSKQRDSIFLPTGKAKKMNILQPADQSCQSIDKESEISQYEPTKKKITFRTESDNAKEDQMFEKDPRKIINYLQEIKGKNHKKFKALNFACEGKAYKYNDQIVIPEFPMVWKESDF